MKAPNNIRYYLQILDLYGPFLDLKASTKYNILIGQSRTSY